MNQEPPYDFYHSNDTIFYSTESMDEFAVALILNEGAEWTYSVSSEFSPTKSVDATVLESTTIDLNGTETNAYNVDYFIGPDVGELIELSPPLRTT